MAMLESMDNNIGRILNTLKKNKLMENTLYFLSDNGGHHASQQILKERTYWEGGLRVPFAIGMVNYKLDKHTKKVLSHWISSLL